MSRDIVDTSGRLPLVVARRIQHQVPQQLAVLGDDAHVAVGHQQHDRLAAVLCAKTDVPQPRVVAQGDDTVVVDLVIALQPALQSG